MGKFLSSTDLAIALASKKGTLMLNERVSRFGGIFVAICDEHGLIEVADNLVSAHKRVRECAR